MERSSFFVQIQLIQRWVQLIQHRVQLIQHRVQLSSSRVQLFIPINYENSEKRKRFHIPPFSLECLCTKGLREVEPVRRFHLHSTQIPPFTVFSLKLQLVTICNRFISFFYKSVFQNFPLVTRIGTISEYTTYIYN